MPMRKEAALDAARAIINGPRAAESPRLENIRAWLTPGVTPTVEIPVDAPAVMRRLATKADTNYLPLILKTFSQGMKVDGFYTPTSPDRAGAWQYWQRNRLDALQTGTHRGALGYGAAYEMLLPGSNGPVSEGFSPRRMTAVYQDAARDEFPMMALDIDRSLIRLVDEEAVYYIGAENGTRGLLEPQGTSYAAAQLVYIEARRHDAGVCPVVRFRDRMLLDGEETFGIIEPLLAVQARLNETTFGQLLTQFFGAFKQRYVVGWIPKTEAEELRAGASEMWYFKDDNVKLGQLEEADLTKYIAAKNDVKRDLASLAQLPISQFGTDGISNVSAEAVALTMNARDLEAGEITTSLGESWESWARLASHLDGDALGAQDFSMQTRWADKSARTMAQMVDALGKMASQLGFPKEVAWEMVPGLTQTDIERAKIAARREAAQLRAATLAQAALQARQDPQIAQTVNRGANAS